LRQTGRGTDGQLKPNNYVNVASSTEDKISQTKEILLK